MKKRLMSILLVLCMVLTMLPMTAIADTEKKTPAYGIFGDGGYYMWSLAGSPALAPVTVETYPSVRSVQINFPDTPSKVFYVENQGNNQVVLKITNAYNDTGFSYIGLDGSAKGGEELKSVDKPFVWEVYKEGNGSLDFSLRPANNKKVVVAVAGGKTNPRTRLVLAAETKMKAPKSAIFRFMKAPDQSKAPVAEDYIFSNMIQTEGSVVPVKIEPKSGKSQGAISIFYNGSPTLPSNPGSYNVTFDVAAAAPAWKEAKGLSAGTLVIEPKPSTAAPVGQSIKMGGINWRAIDVRDGKVLVISDLILEERKYQENSDVGFEWANSSLRSYLNGDFFNRTFSQAEKDRILASNLVNRGGANTTDKVFLLSLDEVNRYFPDNSAKIAYADRTAPALAASSVNTFGYSGVWQPYVTWNWWLRTPMDTVAQYAYSVDPEGAVKEYSNSYGLGVRPAMWIKLEGGGFVPYEPLKFNQQPSYFTKEDMVLAIAEDIIHEHAGDWVYNFGYAARGPAVQKTQELGATYNMPPGYMAWMAVYRMRCWGVLGHEYFDPLAEVTYGEFRDNLMKTMNWLQKYAADGSKNFAFTKDTLAIAEKRAGISDTSAGAKPVKEEIKRLSKEIIYWLHSANAGHSGVRLLEFPTRRNYKVGEGFDITGLMVVTGPYGKETNVNNKLTFNCNGVTITPGRPFQEASDKAKSVKIYYEGRLLGDYPVYVTK